MKIVFRYAIEPRHLESIRKSFPALNLVVCPGDAEIAAHLPDADALIGGWSLPAEMLDQAPRLKWVQATFAGVNSFLSPELKQREIPLTNFRGVSAPNIADHVMALMLSFARGMPELMRRQSRREWRGYGEEPKTFELAGQRLGIVGLGEIGRALAHRAKGGFDMEVWGIRRRISQSDAGDGIDRVLALDGLEELLSACDHVVLAIPATPATDGLMSARRIACMTPTSYFYNISRGSLVDHDALIAALQNGSIAGAALDVTTPEPLPPDSVLWQMPNVIITGHTSGPTPHFWDRGTAIIMENIGRFLDGRELKNLVDIEQGY